MFPFHNGDAAPDFTLPKVSGGEWSLSSHKGKMVCLYFARGEYCPTTRGEMANFNSYSRLFPKMNCELAFIVNGGLEEHGKWARELKMRLPILVDSDGAIGEKFGVYGVNHDDIKREDYRNYIAPSVYLIDTFGDVAGWWISSVPRGLPSPEAILGILGYAEHNGGRY